MLNSRDLADNESFLIVGRETQCPYTATTGTFAALAADRSGAGLRRRVRGVFLTVTSAAEVT